MHTDDSPSPPSYIHKIVRLSTTDNNNNNNNYELPLWGKI